jgi:hypothetical protein
MILGKLKPWTNPMTTTIEQKITDETPECVSLSTNIFLKSHSMDGGMRYRSWLGHYPTSRKVAGSIPDEVTGFFNWPNSSSRTMTLRLSQPLTEMSTRNLPGGKGPMVLHGFLQG